MRVKTVKVGRLRLNGRAKEPVKCLFVFTYEDVAFVFYDFYIEINIKHITFKKKMMDMNKKIIRLI